MTDAIREDVSGDAEKHTGQEGTNTTQAAEAERLAQAAAENNPRNKVLEDIAAKFNRRRAEEIEQTTGGEPPGDEVGGEDPAGRPIQGQAAPDGVTGQEQQPRVAPAVPDDLPVVKGDDGQWYMPLKVDGREQRIPLTKAQAQLQKHQAADQRLQHATQMLRDAEQRAALVAAREQQLAQRLQPPQEGAATPGDSRASARAFVEKLLDSDPDQAAESLVRLMESRTPAIDIERLRSEVTQEVMTAAQRKEAERELATAYNQFSEEFPELVNDDDFATLVDRRTVDILREKPYLTPSQVLKEAGEYVRAKFALPAAQRQAPAGESRQARKQNLTPIPRGTGQAVRRANDTPPPQTPASYVARLRAARGQG